MAERGLTVVSGGQTGVDRAALDVALSLGLRAGGWCPAGRCAEDGAIPARYPLRETPSGDVRQRTQWNVRDADGTLVLTRGAPAGGTLRTIDLAQRMNRPVFVVDVDHPPSADAVHAWLAAMRIRNLNVAGPRESEAPGIGAAAAGWLREVLEGGRPGPDRRPGSRHPSPTRVIP